MAQKLLESKSRAPRTVDVDKAVEAFLQSYPRMPAADERRLYALIHKSKQGPLTRRETQRLQAMLAEVDRKSLGMLKHAAAFKRKLERFARTSGKAIAEFR
jgi:hypothetical protein